MIGRRPGFRPTFHQRGVNNNNIIHVKLSTCQSVCNDCYTNVALINARSVKNKTLAINEEIIQHAWGILAITETWLKQTGDEAIVTQLLSPGYTFHHVARPRGRGGGVAVVYRNTYNTKILPKLHSTTIELIRLQFTNPSVLVEIQFMGRLSPACDEQDIWNIIGLLLRTRAAIHRSINLRYSYCHRWRF